MKRNLEDTPARNVAKKRKKLSPKKPKTKKNKNDDFQQQINQLKEQQEQQMERFQQQMTMQQQQSMQQQQQSIERLMQMLLPLQSQQSVQPTQPEEQPEESEEQPEEPEEQPEESEEQPEVENLGILDSLCSISGSQEDYSDSQPSSSDSNQNEFVELEEIPSSSNHQFENPDPPGPSEPAFETPRMPTRNRQFENSPSPPGSPEPIEETPDRPVSPTSPSLLQYHKRQAKRHKNSLSQRRKMNITIHVMINHNFQSGRKIGFRKAKGRHQKQTFQTKCKSLLIKNYYKKNFPNLYREWGAHFDTICPVKPADTNVWLRNMSLYGSVDKPIRPQDPLPEPPNPADEA